MGITRYEKVNREDEDEEEEVNIDLNPGGRHLYINEGGSTSSSSPVSNHHNNPPAGNNSSLTNDIFEFRRKHKMTFFQTALVTGFLVCIYFALSIGLTFYQSYLLQKFQYPLTMVLYHLVIKFVLAATFRVIYRLVTGRRRVEVDCRSSLKIAPVGLASGIDIGFSNWGLELVQISLYTMTKSTTIIFILIFAILLKLEKKSWSLASIVVLISGGLFMFTYKATKFDVQGFIFLLIASLSAGIRWSFAQLLMQKSKLGLHNPIDMIYHMQPWMILAVVPVILIFESDKILSNWHLLGESSFDAVYYMFLQITFGAVLAFWMEFSEFVVLSTTSSLTLSVANIFKEICQLVLAVETKGDQMSFVNVIGLVLCLCGIICHVTNKYYVYLRSNPTTAGGEGPDEDQETGDIRMKSGGGSSRQQQPLLDRGREHLLESDDDDEESLFDMNGKLKSQNSHDILDDIVNRRDQHYR